MNIKKHKAKYVQSKMTNIDALNEHFHSQKVFKLFFPIKKNVLAPYIIPIMMRP